MATILSAVVSPSTLSLTVGGAKGDLRLVQPTGSEILYTVDRWVSSNTSVATVVTSTLGNVDWGEVTPVGAGTAIITGYSATDPTKYGTCTVTVTGSSVVSVTGVSLNASSISLEVGDTYSLVATVRPSNATDKGVSWTSSNSRVARVSGGTVTAVSSGSATITVTTDDGGYTATCRVTVTAAVIDVTAITVSPTSATLRKGGTRQITATIYPSNATDKSVEWLSLSSSVATVSSSGLVTARGFGSTEIWASASNGSVASCAITVIYPVSIIVSAGSTALEVGETTYLSTITTMSNSSRVTDNGGYRSSNSGVVTVNSSGVVTAVGAGTATITAYATDDSSVTGRVTITVTPAVVPVTSVTVSPGTLSLEVGDTAWLTATVYPTNATDRSVIWSSNSSSIASVSSSGYVTAKAVGTTNIYAITNDGNKTDYCTVTVKAKTIDVTGISVSPASTNLSVGDTVRLYATVSPSNATNKTVYWYSGNTDRATVNSSGVVTGVASGAVNIYAYTADGGYEDYCTVNVYIPAVAVVSPQEADIRKNETVQLSVTIQPSNATNKNVTWSSYDSSIASVNSSGLVTGVGFGTVYIVATPVLGTGNSACSVRVIRPVSIEITSQTTEIKVGNTAEIIAITTMDNEAQYTDVGSWTSSDNNIATVSNGVVTAKAEGTVTITAYATDDSGVYDTITINVVPDKIPVTGISLNTNEITIAKGESFQLVATVLPDDATNKDVIWDVSSNNCITVSDSGLVTAIGGGSQSVFVYAADDLLIYTTCLVHVTVAIEAVSLEAEQTVTDVGSNMLITATVSPSDATNKGLTWQSSNAATAPLVELSDGETVRFFAKHAGKVTVYAFSEEDSDIFGTVTITIHPGCYIYVDGDGWTKATPCVYEDGWQTGFACINQSAGNNWV